MRRSFARINPKRNDTVKITDLFNMFATPVAPVAPVAKARKPRAIKGTADIKAKANAKPAAPLPTAKPDPFEGLPAGHIAKARADYAKAGGNAVKVHENLGASAKAYAASLATLYGKDWDAVAGMTKAQVERSGANMKARHASIVLERKWLRAAVLDEIKARKGNVKGADMPWSRAKKENAIARGAKPGKNPKTPRDKARERMVSAIKYLREYTADEKATDAARYLAALASVETACVAIGINPAAIESE